MSKDSPKAKPIPMDELQTTQIQGNEPRFHATIDQHADALIDVLEQIGPGESLKTAIQKVREAKMWAEQGLQDISE